MTKWITRWKYEIADKPTRPGIYRLKTGGYLVRCKVTNPRSGARVELMRALRDVTLSQAVQELEAIRSEEHDRVRGKTRQRVLWSDFAVSLMAERKASGKLASAATLDWWRVSLEHYLLPEFGHLMVDEIDRVQHFDPFLKKVAGWLEHGKPSLRHKPAPGEPVKIIRLMPRTANGWLRILRTICRAMTVRYNLARNPFDGVDFFTEARAYTREQPNRLRGDVLPKWIATAKRLYPQHYAMIVLGFLLGVRPSHIRPLRRKGASPDVLWKEGVLLIRRSNTRAGKIMDKTKTGLDQEIALPAEMMRILKEHADSLPPGPMRDSELLFPSLTGGMRTRTALAKPFAAVNAALGLEAKFTPRGMRRTFNNSARQAGTHDVVTRSISGHQTEEMQQHYSMAEFEEQRGELEKILGSMLKEESDARADEGTRDPSDRADEDAARGDGSSARGGARDESLLGGRGVGDREADRGEASRDGDAVGVRAPAMSSDAIVRPIPEEGDEAHDEAPTAELPLAEGNPQSENIPGGDKAVAAELVSASKPGGQAGSMLTFPSGAVLTTFADDDELVDAGDAGAFFDKALVDAMHTTWDRMLPAWVDAVVGFDPAKGSDETHEVMLKRLPDGRLEVLRGQVEAIQSPSGAPPRGGEKGGNDSTDPNETSSGKRDSNPRHQAWELGAEVKKTAFPENLLSQACSGMGELGQDLPAVGWDEGGEAAAGSDPDGGEGEPPSRAPAPPWPWGPARRFRIDGPRVIRLADEPLAIGGAS